jgi:hypothetical protein
MTDNRNSEAAWAYHEATKHSNASVRANPHFLDWANQPRPFKIYPALKVLGLPGEVRPTGVAALSAIAQSIPGGENAAPDLEAIAQLLYLSAGVTRHRKYPGGEIYFRAAACTGALYEVEVYLVCGDLANLEAGLYHFAPAEFGLRRLRVGDCRTVLAEATAADPAIAHGGYRLHLHLLAECLEISGPHLSPFRLGQRHCAGESSGGRDGFGVACKGRVRLPGCGGQSPAGR